MKCPRCGADVPEGSRVCSKCFYLMSEVDNYDKYNKKTPVTKKWWFWVIIAVAVAAVVCCILFAGKSDGKKSSGAAGASATATASEDADSTDSASSGGQNSDSSINWIGEGTYAVGSDIKAGTYFVKAEDGKDCSIEVDKDTSGSDDSVIASDVFSTYTFVSVTDGEYFTVSGGKMTTEDNAQIPAQVGGQYQDGVYRVGKDIPAGTYTMTATNGELGYYEVDSTCTGSIGDIVSSGIVESPVDVTVTNGQFLRARTATFAAK